MDNFFIQSGSLFNYNMAQISLDKYSENYKSILESARGKANYYVNRDTEVISKEDLYNFYNIGKIYRNE